MTAWGKRVECERCQGDSYTGPVCTRCLVAEGRETGFAWSSMGTHFRAAPGGSERTLLTPPEYVCPPFGSTPEGGIKVGRFGCHEAPGPVEGLALDAWDHDWQVLTQHSRGGVVGGTGKQLAVADMWSVRFRREGWMGYAVRRGSVWSSVCVAGVDLPPFLGLGVTELGQWLADPARDASWYQAIRDRKAEQAAATKARAAASRAAAGTKRVDHAL